SIDTASSCAKEGGKRRSGSGPGRRLVAPGFSPSCGAAAQLRHVAPEGLGGELEPLGKCQVGRPGRRDLVGGQPEPDRVDGRLNHVTRAVRYRRGAKYPTARAFGDDLDEAPYVAIDQCSRHG